VTQIENLIASYLSKIENANVAIATANKLAITYGIQMDNLKAKLPKP
jgi:hypothetical protein